MSLQCSIVVKNNKRPSILNREPLFSYRKRFDVYPQNPSIGPLSIHFATLDMLWSIPAVSSFAWNPRFVYGNVFTDGSSDGSLGGAISNAGEDDTAFLKGKVRKRIYSTHRNTCLSGVCQV